MHIVQDDSTRTNLNITKQLIFKLSLYQMGSETKSFHVKIAKAYKNIFPRETHSKKRLIELIQKHALD